MREQKSRRQSRSLREDTTRLWRDGKFDENAPELQRWSREAKTPQAKIKKVLDSSREELGTVIEVNRKTCKILDEKGEVQNCQLFKTLDLKEFSNLAVGDQVYFNSKTGKSGIIIKLKSRANHIYRMGPKDRKYNKIVLAANMDQVVIVLSMQEPDFNGKQLDRFLLRINHVEAEKLICINKTDLSQHIPVEVDYLKNLGWRFVFVSVTEQKGIEDFWKLLKGKKSLLMGPSGVGKSSLIKALTRVDEIKVQNVRKSDGRGRHTTTRSSAYFGSENTWIIDSPGIRELTVWDLEIENILDYFLEFQRGAGQEFCQFRNCTHLYEEGCIVQKKVAEGVIPEFRYESFRRIMENSQRNQ